MTSGLRDTSEFLADTDELLAEVDAKKTPAPAEAPAAPEDDTAVEWAKITALRPPRQRMKQIPRHNRYGYGTDAVTLDTPAGPEAPDEPTDDETAPTAPAPTPPAPVDVAKVTPADEDQAEEPSSRDLISRLFGTNEEAHARADALEAKASARRSATDKGKEAEGEEADVDATTTVEEPAPGESVSAVTAPATTAPAAGAPKKPSTSKVKAAAGNSRLRWVAFNGTAAGAGYGFGLVDVLGRYLPYAEQAATGTVGLALAVAGGLGTYRLAGYVTGHPAVTLVLPFAPVVRIGVALGAAAFGYKAAATAVTWINRYGQEWGLGADALSLLLTAGAMCGGLWWFVDRRVRSWPWAGRLLVRIPLASALLAAALYAPGN